MIDLTETATFDTPITVPEGTDTHDHAAEDVELIAQRLANRTAYLKARADDAAQRGSDNIFTAHNTFTQTVQSDVDLHADHDVVADRNVHAVQDVTAGRDVIASRHVVATDHFKFAAVKPRTAIVSLNTGVVMGVSPGQALMRDTFFNLAECASWVSGQFVAWRILLPSESVLKNLQVIHSESTTAPNRFNLMKRSGAVYDFLGSSTAAPSVTSLLSAPVDGPVVAGLWTSVIVPPSPVTIDNSVNEYWITWASTGLHIADGIAEISVGYDDVGPGNG